MIKRIAVFAGGGTHGYTQMVALAKKELEVGDLYKYYDLMIGSSVGAINAAALATGNITAAKLLEIYPEWIKVIFKKNWNPFAFPKYDRNNFIKIWTDRFGLMKMKDCKTKIAITSVDLCQDKNHYFKSWEPKDGEVDLLITVLRSFAAPIFFGAIVDEPNKKVWTDGGSGYNNIPLDDAIIESLLLKWLQTTNIQIDVYGTGFVNTDQPFDQVKNFRWLKQALEFINPGQGGLARAQSRIDVVDKMTKVADALQPKVKFNYWDIQIDKKYDGLDRVDCLDQLYKYGVDMAKAPLISI